MNKGTLSFALNGEFLGIAFQDNKLKQGPIYPSVSLLHCAGCRLETGIPAPNYMK
jgi:E3 ubiquitin-protein ligase NRDP1